MSSVKDRRVPVSSLNIDPSIQRDLDKRRVEKIADELEMNAIGVITVSERSDGHLFVVDGMHRVAALRLAGGDDETIRARVFSGLSLPEEAALFRKLNNTKKPQAFDLFKARIVEGEETAVAIRDMLAEHGWTLGMSGGAGTFGAVAAIERVYRMGSEVADRAIATITRLWGHDRDGVDWRIVEAFGVLFNRYGEALNTDELVDRVSRTMGNPGKLIGRGLDFRDITGKTLPRAMATALLEIYNKGRKTRALPPWDA